MNVYAQPGSSMQQIGGTCPSGWIQMQGPRPSPYHVAQLDGTWELDAERRRQDARDAIDLAAGKARNAFVSPGDYVAEEYRLAKQDADAWVAAGKPSDAVPDSIAVWAQARGWTAEQAAQDIIDTEAAWMDALAAIRQARLLGKAAVDAAADDADFDAVAGPYIAQLAAIADQAP